MKPKTLLVLTALVAVLAAFVFFVDRDLPSSEERADLANRVLPVETDDVAVLAIDWDGRTVRLERRATPAAREEGEDGDATTDEEAAGPVDWRLVEPYEALADRALVDTLLDALTGLRKSRTLEDVERAEVGLDAPRGSVAVITAEGETRLLVGAPVPGSESVIVGRIVGGAGEPDVYVTSGAFVTQLEREAEAWRSREVVAIARDSVERVRIESGRGDEGGEPLVLVRRGPRFHLESPVDDLASQDLADQLLGDLVILRALRFLDDPATTDAERGLDPPRTVVTATLEGGDTLRVELGSPVAGEDGAAGPEGEAVYARVGEQRFETVTGLTEAAARPAGEWRSSSWIGLESFEVGGLEIGGPLAGGDPLRLSRQGVDWRRGEDTIAYTAASDLLFALTEAEGTVVATVDVEGQEPLLTVTLTSNDGDDETLTLYPGVPGSGDPAADSEAGDGTVHPARSSIRTGALLLPESVVTGLREALEAVRRAEPEAPPSPSE